MLLRVLQLLLYGFVELHCLDSVNSINNDLSVCFVHVACWLVNVDLMY